MQPPVPVPADGRKVLLGSSEWDDDPATASLAEPRAILRGHKSAQSIAVAPGGQRLASAGQDVFVWEPDQWDRVTGKGRLQLPHDHGASAVAFSPDGKSLASGDGRGTIRIWDLLAAKVVQEFPPHGQRITKLVYTPDGVTLISAGTKETVVVLDVAAGTEKRFQTKIVQVECLALSPDGKLLAIGGYDGSRYDGKGSLVGVPGQVLVWNLAEGKAVHRLGGHAEGVTCVAFTPDGKMLASGSQGQVINLWNLASGEVAKTINGNEWVTSVAISPDGRTLAGADFHGGIKLWNLSSGKELASFKAHPLWTRLVFMPDGKTLVSCGADGIKLWNIAPR
jgi:WD40 repeat protein